MNIVNRCYSPPVYLANRNSEPTVCLKLKNLECSPACPLTSTIILGLFLFILKFVFEIVNFQSRVASGMPALTIRLFTDAVVDKVPSTGSGDILSLGNTWEVVTCSEAV